MATPPRVILVPIDFSDVSHRALDHAKMVAGAPGAKIVLVNVVNPMPAGVGVDITATMPPIDVDADTQAAKKSLVGWAKAVPGATTSVRIGVPADEILAAAKDEGAELIVMGTHGRKGIARMVLGSVAEAVARRSSVPVVLVH